MKTALSIIIPCYNEEKNIPLIVERFRKSIPQDAQMELILVDNGSSDLTNYIIKKFSKKYLFIRPARVKKNVGYGFGIWTGIRAAKGEYICWTHADMQTDPYDTIKAYQLITKQKNSKKCFVKGNRKNRPLIDTFFTFGMSLFETIILKTWIYDINAQPNLFHRNFLKHVGKPPKDFSFDLYFYYIAKRKSYEIIRFPVLFKPRIHGKSHWNTSLKSKWKFIKRTLEFTLNMRKQLKK